MKEKTAVFMKIYKVVTQATNTKSRRRENNKEYKKVEGSDWKSCILTNR